MSRVLRTWMVPGCDATTWRTGGRVRGAIVTSIDGDGQNAVTLTPDMPVCTFGPPRTLDETAGAR